MIPVLEEYYKIVFKYFHNPDVQDLISTLLEKAYIQGKIHGGLEVKEIYDRKIKE